MSKVRKNNEPRGYRSRAIGLTEILRVLPDKEIASLVDRLEDIDRARENDLRNHIALDVIEHDFGNRYDLADHFTRGELTYTHEFWRVLHSIGFGFGDRHAIAGAWAW